ncbi:hypothetical protein JW921_05865 [Candidatus Fermentibacterales bacterium]|nr:hypothetical protein [Candidatus Fermentibacterales bacterium]
MAGIEEIVIPWDPESTWSARVKAQAYTPGRVIAGVAFLVALIPSWLLLTDQPLWAKGLDVLAVVGIVALAVWGYRQVMARPETRQRVAVTRLLLASPEHAGAYACLEEACDYLKWVVEQKETTTGTDGKPLVRFRRVYPSVAFVVDLDTVRRILESEGQPLPPSGIRPTLGQEIRLRFDTTQPGMDSEKLAGKLAVLQSKLGLNGFASSVDFSRGETRHVDVRIAQFPEGDLYARYGGK